jgi:hypothetical protein
MIKIRELSQCVAFRTLPYIYNNTSVKSQLRRLMVSEVALFCDTARLDSFPDSFPHEFLVDLAKELMMMNRLEGGRRITKATDFFVSLHE